VVCSIATGHGLDIDYRHPPKEVVLGTGVHVVFDLDAIRSHLLAVWPAHRLFDLPGVEVPA
jgi:hypothetical protein